MKEQLYIFLAVLISSASGVNAQAQTLPGILPSSMPILTSGTETFTGNAAISGSSTITVGAYEYFLVGGGGAGGNAPGGDGEANGGNGGQRVSGSFTLGAPTSFTVTIGGGGAIGGTNSTGGTGGSTSIAGVGTANGGTGGTATGGTGGGAAGSTVGSITGNSSFLYGGGGGDGDNGLIVFGGGASGGGSGAAISNTAIVANSTPGAANSGGGGGGGADRNALHANPSAGGSGVAFVHYYGTTAATTGGASAFENTVNDGTDTTRRFNASGSLGITTTAASQVAVFSGNLSGGALTKAGLGTLVLAGSNSYTTSAINSGTLQIGKRGHHPARLARARSASLRAPTWSSIAATLTLQTMPSAALVR